MARASAANLIGNPFVIRPSDGVVVATTMANPRARSPSTEAMRVANRDPGTLTKVHAATGRRIGTTRSASAARGRRIAGLGHEQPVEHGQQGAVSDGTVVGTYAGNTPAGIASDAGNICGQLLNTITRLRASTGAARRCGGFAGSSSTAIHRGGEQWRRHGVVPEAERRDDRDAPIAISRRRSGRSPWPRVRSESPSAGGPGESTCGWPASARTA